MEIKIKEKDLQKAILDYLRFKKFFCWKNNTVGIYRKDTGHYIPSQSVGSPDIFLVLPPNGILIGIEVKNATARLTDAQEAFQKALERAGGKYFVARSLDDVIKLLKSYPHIKGKNT